MDVETELPKEGDVKDTPQVEDVQNGEEASLDKNKDSSKKSHKTNSKRKRRSRSKTPQAINDEPKIIHISMKKIEEEAHNGNEETSEQDIEKNGEEITEESKPMKDKVADVNGSDGETNLTEIKNGVDKQENGSSNGVSEDNCNDVEPTGNEFEGFIEIEEAKEALKEQETEINETVKDKEHSEKPGSPKKSSQQESKSPESDSVEMEPLVVGDEVESELQFLEENSDKESGKGSPVIPRCFTRRSFTRNIPTPRTPKLSDDPDSEKNSVTDQTEETICNLPNDINVPKIDLNDSSDSLDTLNTSTNVEVGGNSTRLDFIETTNTPTEENHFDEAYRNNLRARVLSARRPLRVTDDYRKKVLINAQYRSDLNLPYELDEPCGGIKRKLRSMTPDGSKKQKLESPGYTSFLSNSFAGFTTRFKSHVDSSTPELISYKDERSDIHFSDGLESQQIEDAGGDESKKWCSLM
ncbi:unnamed protein product [Diabrotica balteata]|uniref:Uncharacterized protein n=1 Tax=Diabrotica balteata TaxID=107213 RepID=A0A9N9XDW7_DIABA|nr:unnamed protein product [Diabrotica balteata]